MSSKSDRQRMPVDVQRELLGLAILHLRLDRPWDGRDLGGETHALSEFARQYAVDLLSQLLDGKRPYLPRPTPKRRMSADERYVTLIFKALFRDGARTMEDAYRAAAGPSKVLADGKHDARIREAKRAWQKHWQERSQAIGPGHRLRLVPPKEMRGWMTKVQSDPRRTERRSK